jgi:hypothetical protein
MILGNVCYGSLGQIVLTRLQAVEGRRMICNEMFSSLRYDGGNRDLGGYSVCSQQCSTGLHLDLHLREALGAGLAMI